MLTPNRIRGYQFQQAGRGTYRAEEVDDFLNQVVESYEQVFKENGELVKKLSILATKLDEYRKEETSVRKALANAQNFIDRLVEDAKKEAEKIVTDAQERAKNVDAITNAKIKVMVDEVEGKMRIAYDKATAQAKQTKDNALAEAETILLEAREKSEKMISDAKKEATGIISGATSAALKDAEELRLHIEKEKELLDKLKEMSNQFKTELVVLYERQITNVEKMPDYVLNKEFEDDVNEVIENRNDLVDEIEETFENLETEAEEETFFDADDLINEYASKNIDEKETFELDVEEYDDLGDEISAVSEDVVPEEVSETPTYDFADEVIDELPDDLEDDIVDDLETEEDDFTLDFDIAQADEAVQYEDVFSDSGNSEGFRFTAEDFDDINRGITEETAEDIEENLDIFAENTDENDIYIAREEQPKKFDIAFSDTDAVEVEKDENMFLNQDNEEVKVEEGFKLFDNIDFSENDSFDMANESEENTDDGDNDGFNFLRNIFGKNKD